MIADWVRPMMLADVPWCWSDNVTVNTMPVKAKLMSGACTMTARKSGSWRMSRNPSKDSRQRPFRSPSLGAGWNEPFIALDVNIDTP